MFNQNNFSKDIIKLYLKNPSCLNIIFDYHLASGDLSASDHSNNNIIHHIVMKNDIKTLVSVLNCNRVNVRNLINQRNINGDLPMHIAVRNQNEEIAKLLDNAGTDKSIRNKNGEYISIDNSNYDKESPQEDTIDFANFMNHYSDSPSSYRTFVKISNKPEKQMDQLDDQTTTEFIRLLEKKLGMNNMMGGKKNKSNKRSKSSKRSKRSKSSKRSTPSESSNIHDKVLKDLIDLMGNEEDGRAMKAGLYGMVKEKNPTLNNIDRANKMVEYMNDKKIMKEITKNLDEYRKIIANARKMKEEQRKSMKQ
jgi:hypothetical protein